MIIYFIKLNSFWNLYSPPSYVVQRLVPQPKLGSHLPIATRGLRAAKNPEFFHINLAPPEFDDYFYTDISFQHQALHQSWYYSSLHLKGYTPEGKKVDLYC